MAKGDRKEISTKDKFALWGKAAGCCEICKRPLWEEGQFHNTGNFSNFAHICAYSKNGPRFDESLDTPGKKNDISNIVLLCQDCHKMIDADSEQFTTEFLVDIKNEWESIVESTITAKAINHVNVLRYAVPIGVHDFGVLDCDWRSSLASMRYAPFDKKPFDLYSDSLDHATHSSLDILADDLIRSFNRFSSTIKNDSLPTAVFAIAPQPLLVQLGYLLGGTRNSIVFQRRREKPHWQWSEECLPPEFAFELSDAGTGEDAILIASISGDINDESLPVELMDSGCPIARFFVKAAGSVNSADSKAAAGLFRSGMDQALYRIHEKYPHVRRLHIFPAMPNSFNVMLGQSVPSRIFRKLIHT